MKCVVCGCTDERACDGGCSWSNSDPPVCSRCASGAPFDYAGHTPEVVFGPGSGRSQIEVSVAGFEAQKKMKRILNRAFKLGRKLGQIEGAARERQRRSPAMN